MIAPTKTVTHALYPITQVKKTSLVTSLLRQLQSDRVLIFTRTKHRARNLAQKLAMAGFRTSALQGNMSQNQRQAALDGFRRGKFDILVATDIAARGIDVSDISHVINFDMPDTVDAYIHRIGRTGRAKATGKAFTFCLPEDGKMIRDIEKILGSRITRERLSGFDYDDHAPTNSSQHTHPKQTQHLPSTQKHARSNYSRSHASQRKTV